MSMQSLAVLAPRRLRVCRRLPGTLALAEALSAHGEAYSQDFCSQNSRPQGQHCRMRPRMAGRQAGLAMMARLFHEALVASLAVPCCVCRLSFNQAKPGKTSSLQLWCVMGAKLAWKADGEQRAPAQARACVLVTLDEVPGLAYPPPPTVGRCIAPADSCAGGCVPAEGCGEQGPETPEREARSDTPPGPVPVQARRQVGCCCCSAAAAPSDLMASSGLCAL